MKNEMIRKTKRLLLKLMPMEKPKTSWMTVYMCFGISIGMALGSLMGNISIGMCYGVAAGVLLGTAMDASEKKRRAEILGEERK